MKLICAVAVAALAAGCGGASESHNSSQSGATAQAGIANPGGQPTVTLKGCLQNADTLDTAPQPTGSIGHGSAGEAVDQKAAGRGSPGERFTLTSARSESDASSPAAGSYILDGNMEALRQHVRQQVRVTGTLDAAAANTAGPQRIRVQTVQADGTSTNCTQ